jgi:hypothetical protein
LATASGRQRDVNETIRYALTILGVWSIVLSAVAAALYLAMWRFARDADYLYRCTFRVSHCLMVMVMLYRQDSYAVQPLNWLTWVVLAAFIISSVSLMGVINDHVAEYRHVCEMSRDMSPRAR